MWMELAEQRFPGIDIVQHETEPEITAIRDEVLNSRAYLEAAAEQFNYLNLQQFKLFGTSPNAIAELEKVLTVENYLNPQYLIRQVEEFKRLVGISEMEWVSYRYATKDEE